MSRLNAKAAASILMLALMIAAPAIMGLQALTAQALTGVSIQLVPSKVVEGQDILFMVKQVGGTFTSGAPIFFEIDADGIWDVPGFYLISLQAGRSTLPPGTIIYVPSNLELYPKTTGTWWLLISDSSDGSSGVAGTQFTVESGTPPRISVNGYYNEPASQVSITYHAGPATTSPSVTLNMSAMLRVTPGDTVTVQGALFRGNFVTVYFLYIYSNYWGDGFAMAPVQLAATSLTGGAFSVDVTIPNAPEGIHAILAVDDQGYYAFTFVYVYPTVTVTPFSIRGQIGDTITVTGVGFPANAKISAVTLYTTTTLAGSPLGMTLISGGTVDSLGRVSFTARLDVPVPDKERGLLNLTVTYDPYAPGQDFKFDPDENTTTDTFGYVVAASTPLYLGDEALILPAGLEARSSTISSSVGDRIQVTVVNFPAGATLDVYFGPVKVGTIRTDANGAGSALIQVPELPGYDENRAQIRYYLRVKDPATKLMATGIPYSKEYAQWTVTIQPSITISYHGIGAGPKYVLPGSTITVIGRGLAPFDLVNITETISSNTFNVLDYSMYYNTQVITGYTVGSSVMTTATGVFVVQYQAAYDRLPGAPTPATGTMVTVTVKLATTPTGPESKFYYEVAAPKLNVTTRSSGGYPSGKPGDRISIRIGPGLVPSGGSPAETVAYKLYFEGSPITMYNTTTSAIIPYITAKKPDDTIVVDIYVPNLPSGPKVISLRASYNNTDVNATWFIISNPETAAAGTARIMVLPGYEVRPSGTSTIMVAGWNFEVRESDYYPVYLGISGVGEGKIVVDENGAFIVNLVEVLGLESLELPQGTYAVYVKRSAPAFAPVPTVLLTITPNISISGYTGSVNIGADVTLDALGLDPNKVYMLRWSNDPSTPGVFIRDASGAWLRFTTDGNGTKRSITFEVPFGLPYNIYYIQVVPADNPETILATFGVRLLPTTNFTIVGLRYFFTPMEWINLELSNAKVSLGTYANRSLTADEIWNLIINGTVLVRFETLDGTVVATVEATATYDKDANKLSISAQVPNLNATGVYGVSVRLTNGTIDTGWIKVAGVLIGDTGGILVNIGGVMADLAKIKTDLGTVLVRLSELNATLVRVQDGVATLQTTLGVVKTDLATLRTMIENVNVTLVGKANEITAILNTKFGEVQASLDALTDLINGGFARVNDNLVTIQTQLGYINMSISDLQTLISTTADSIILTINDATGTLGSLIIEKSGEILANISVLVEDLKPLIVSLNGSMIQLQTLLGEVNTTVSELLAGQAEIKDLITTKSGDIIAVVETKAGEMNATLSAALDMILEGVVNTHIDLIDRLTTLRTFIAQSNAQLADKVDQAIQAISAVNSTLSRVSGKIDALQTSVAGVADTVNAISAGVNTLNSKVDSVAAKTNDIAGKVVQIQSDVADVKTTVSDVKVTVSGLPGKVDDVKSAVNSVGGKVDDVSSKVDNVANSVSGVQSRATILSGTTIVLVVITLILSLLGLRKPE